VPEVVDAFLVGVAVEDTATRPVAPFAVPSTTSFDGVAGLLLAGTISRMPSYARNFGIHLPHAAVGRCSQTFGRRLLICRVVRPRLIWREVLMGYTQWIRFDDILHRLNHDGADAGHFRTGARIMGIIETDRPIYLGAAVIGGWVLTRH
jgi:hypothetical protein